MHPDYFFPLEIRLPGQVKSFLLEFFADDIRKKQSTRRQLGLYNLPKSANLAVLEEEVDNFLQPMGLVAGSFGAFALNGNVKDTNIHVDANRLNTRLSFYELAETPGEIRWWADDGTGYEAWTPSYLSGSPIMDYRYPWIDELQAGKRSWNECPQPIFKVTTNVPSALVMTALPHNVTQGNGFRITVSCQVADRDSQSLENTWIKVRNYFLNSTV